MTPIPVPPPPIQSARFVEAPRPDIPADYRALMPLPPPGSRLDQRPVALDRWGHLAGLGADTDRVVVPDQGGEAYALPIACAVAGYLLFGLLSR